MVQYPRTPEEYKALGEKYRRYKLRCERSISIFLQEKPGFVYDPDASVTSQELYDAFRAWCRKEELPVKPAREFWMYARQHAFAYQLVYSQNVYNAEGKRVRGFLGLRKTDEADPV